MLENIIVTGITDLECYPSCKYKKCWKQCMHDEIVCIPDPKPDIESINEIKVNICIDNYQLIDTILGPKIILHGEKHIKVLYTANNCQQSLHSAHWSIPFCEFILLEDILFEKNIFHIDDIFVGIESVCVKYFDNRVVDLSILFIICPEIDMKHYCQSTKNSPDSCKAKYQICNGKAYNNIYGQ